MSGTVAGEERKAYAGKKWQALAAFNGIVCTALSSSARPIFRFRSTRAGAALLRGSDGRN